MVREREDLENEQIKGKRGGGKGLQSRGRLQLNFESPICVQEKKTEWAGQCKHSSEDETVETSVETTESSKGICTKCFTLRHYRSSTVPREEPLTHFADLQLKDYLLCSFDSS